MNCALPRFIFGGVLRITAGPCTSLRATAACLTNIHRNVPIRRVLSTSACRSSSAQKRFDDLVRKQNKPKPTRKRRAVSASAAYNLNRQRLPQVVSIALCESIDLQSVVQDSGIVNIFHASYVDEEFEDAIHLVKKLEYTLKPNELSEIFVFQDGVVVFWNVAIEQRAQVMRDLERHMDTPYESTVSHSELDTMPFAYTEENRSKIKSDCFILSEDRHTDSRGRSDGILERFALSHAFAASVKVGVWEALLNNLSEPLAKTTRELKRGVIPWNRKEALVRAGEFAALRHSINLNCQLLNKDFYWERADLECFYDMTSRHLTLERRLDALNSRLDYCEELVKMVDNMLALRHASTLEWMIIVLIVIEVIFDILHFADKTPTPVEVVAVPSIDVGTGTTSSLNGAP